MDKSTNDYLNDYYRAFVGPAGLFGPTPTVNGLPTVIETPEYGARRAMPVEWGDQRAGKPEGYTLDRENRHGDGSVRGISNGKG